MKFLHKFFLIELLTIAFNTVYHTTIPKKLQNVFMKKLNIFFTNKINQYFLKSGEILVNSKNYFLIKNKRKPLIVRGWMRGFLYVI
ncbi:hypothetical protein CBF30_01495 [Vagococcus entomophilus]|uniref:Uncharacterized protein n=1 Tax=Vagococcus entomophilus TaxID=1160095 RepID=A0A430AIN2_9ENTE|nr:hypothetical protein CBF30_01495 [Vagococcus entomophilus]